MLRIPDPLVNILFNDPVKLHKSLSPSHNDKVSILNPTNRAYLGIRIHVSPRGFAYSRIRRSMRFKNRAAKSKVGGNPQVN